MNEDDKTLDSAQSPDGIIKEIKEKKETLKNIKEKIEKVSKKIQDEFKKSFDDRVDDIDLDTLKSLEEELDTFSDFIDIDGLLDDFVKDFINDHKLKSKQNQNGP